MSDRIDVVDGWQVQGRADGGFGVSDNHGLVAGPFGTRQEALAAAMKLPKPRKEASRPAEHFGQQ